jgi:hypothetical protein
MVQDSPQDCELTSRHTVLEIQNAGLYASRPRSPNKCRVDVETSEPLRPKDLAQEDRQLPVATPQIIEPTPTEARWRDFPQAVELPEDVTTDNDVVSEQRVKQPLGG